jgi:hypothetical protein
LRVSWTPMLPSIFCVNYVAVYEVKTPFFGKFSAKIFVKS